MLEKKYGKIDKAVIYEQRLMNWVEISYDDAEELDRFSTFVSKCANAMPIHEGLRCLDHERSMQRIVEKLPPALRGKWCDFVSDLNRNNNKRPKFSDLAAFIERAAASANEPYFSK